MPTDLLGRDYETFPAPEPLQTHGPARIIAMCNQKGGVGKTTSSINIAGALSQYGRRVLIVDFDPQGAATVGLGDQRQYRGRYGVHRTVQSSHGCACM